MGRCCASRHDPIEGAVVCTENLIHVDETRESCLSPLWALVLLLFARDVGLRFDFALAIGISFSCAATIAATTEAPPQRRSRRGRIPKRSKHSELDTVPLCPSEEASPFWIILLLV
jgi:hypothetical protein